MIKQNTGKLASLTCWNDNYGSLWGKIKLANNENPGKNEHTQSLTRAFKARLHNIYALQILKANAIMGLTLNMQKKKNKKKQKKKKWQKFVFKHYFKSCFIPAISY